MLPVVRAKLPSFEPPRDAMEVERMIANPPSHCALLTRVGSLVGLRAATNRPLRLSSAHDTAKIYKK